ncbi:MFS transporter [Jeotgalibacillus sp. R-1-5s-1]|uniref:MFS transporter n=1 Tax=Jeotgalibacillus sp. R-1-5s-1 TaxID=2555897 RepID=UPI00141ACBD6|nr:MFS transporter [Jeotgalibacillus sp. R-1-5s-1]
MSAGKLDRSIWGNRLFVKMFSSYSISVMGNYFDAVAIMILFGFVWQADPFLIALIPVAMALPQALLGQFSGVFTDRTDKLKMMFLADLISVVLTLMLVFVSGPWLALLIIACRSVVNVIHYPAQQGMVKEVVPEHQLVQAFSLNGIMLQFSKIAAPLIGGVIAGAVSPQICILINAIMLIISCFVLFSMRREYSVFEKDSYAMAHNNRGDFWISWREGWLIIFTSRPLWVSFMLAFLGLLTIQMIDIQFTTWFRELSPDQPELIGYLFASSGAGAVVMIVLLNRFSNLRDYGWLMGGSLACVGIGFGGIGLLEAGFPLWQPIIFGAIIGLGVGLYSVGFQYIIHKHTSKENIGRVSGINQTISSLCVVVGPLIGGILVRLFGAGAVFMFVGLFCLLIGMVAFTLRNVLWKETVSAAQVISDEII